MSSKSRPSRPEVKSCCPQSDEEILPAYLGGADKAAPTASKRKPPPQPRSRASSAASLRQVGVAGFAARVAVAAGGAAVATTGSADEGGEACVSWRGPRQPSSPRAQSLPVSHSPLASPFLAFSHADLIMGADLSVRAPRLLALHLTFARG